MFSHHAFSVALFISLVATGVLVMTRELHGHLSMDTQQGVQKVHNSPTPRIGGVAVVLGALVGGLFLPTESRSLFFMVALAGLPGFLSGLIEDLTKRVRVRTRLFATCISGLLFSFLTGYSIDSVDIFGVDWVLQSGLISLLFTAFAVGGIANAVNIIDGVNGLAAGTALIVLAALAAVAWEVNDGAVLGLTVVIGAAVFGFLMFNFPFGLIFFGDAGAYTIGYLLAAISIMLPARNPELSPLLGLLALSYPVIETLFSIRRRALRQGAQLGQPDRLHLHSLVYRDMSRKVARAIGVPRLRNSITAVCLWVLPLLSSTVVILHSRSTPMMWAGIALVAFTYVMIYRRVALLMPRSRAVQTPAE